MKFVETVTEYSLWFYTAENEELQKIHPIIASLRNKLALEILNRNRDMPFLHLMPQLLAREKLWEYECLLKHHHAFAEVSISSWPVKLEFFNQYFSLIFMPFLDFLVRYCSNFGNFGYGERVERKWAKKWRLLTERYQFCFHWSIKGEHSQTILIQKIFT